MVTWASLAAQTLKNLPAMQETLVQSLGQEDPWRREWLPTQVFLPREKVTHGTEDATNLSEAYIYHGKIRSWLSG